MSGAAFITSAGACSFEGIEWDLEFGIDRHILWKDVIGSAPRPISKFLPSAFFFPEDVDQVNGRCTLWTTGAQAQQIETRMPAYGAGWVFDLWLPGLPAEAAFPGFGNYSSADKAWKLVKCVALAELTSLGRKNVRQDLFGFAVEFQFSAHGGGTHLNERGQIQGGGFLAGVGIVPPIVPRKFMTHQTQDWSKAASPLPTEGWSTFGGVQHGRRRDAAIALDGLNVDQAEQVIAWARVQRGYAFSMDSLGGFGPGFDSFSCLLREINIRRGAGWWWDITLDLSLA